MTHYSLLFFIDVSREFFIDQIDEFVSDITEHFVMVSPRFLNSIDIKTSA